MPFRIAVLSGKGGAGKTFAAVSLACVSPGCVYLDCDAEEPDGRLFLKPVGIESEGVYVKTPSIDESLCTMCRRCVSFCRFNALCAAKSKIILFRDVCHSCGGCALCCPAGAISETDREVGRVERGTSGDVEIRTGILNTLEASSMPVIGKLLRDTENMDGIQILDCPPGSGCSVMECLRHADFALLVAEPTIFGAENLAAVRELCGMFGIRCGILINKSSGENNPARDYALSSGTEILAEIPYDPEIAALNSEGRIAVYEMEGLRKTFEALAGRIRMEARK